MRGGVHAFMSAIIVPEATYNAQMHTYITDSSLPCLIGMQCKETLATHGSDYLDMCTVDICV